jgi:hypothetical protein
MSADDDIAPVAARSAIQLSAASKLSLTTTSSTLDARHAEVGIADDIDFKAVALGYPVDLVLDRAGVGIDVDRGHSPA